MYIEDLSKLNVILISARTRQRVIAAYPCISVVEPVTVSVEGDECCSFCKSCTVVSLLDSKTFSQFSFGSQIHCSLSSPNYNPPLPVFIRGHQHTPIFQQVFELQPSEFGRKIRHQWLSWTPYQGQAHPASVFRWLSGSSLLYTSECFCHVGTAQWFTNLFDTMTVSLTPCFHGKIILIYFLHLQERTEWLSTAESTTSYHT